jgi:hypothetical protein
MRKGRWVPQGLAAMLLAGMLLSSCAGPHEDVHITRCKNVTAELIAATQELQWAGVEQEIHRPEYAVIRLSFTRGGEAETMHSACWFEYEATEDDLTNLADPLSPYAVIPYDVSLNGVLLTDAQRRKVSNKLDFRQFKALSDGLRRGL